MALASSSLPASPPWWLTTQSCDLPSGGYGAGLGEWAAFLFLSTCSQRVLLSAASGVLLLALLCLEVARLVSTCWRRRRRGGGDDEQPLLDRGDDGAVAVPVVQEQDGLGFLAALTATSVLGSFYAVLLAWSLLYRRRWERDGGGGVLEPVFLALQSAAHMAAEAVVAREKRSRAAAHPLPLRLYWLAAPALTALVAGTSVARLVVPGARKLLPDDWLAVVALVLSLPLPLLAISGATGITPDLATMDSNPARPTLLRTFWPLFLLLGVYLSELTPIACKTGLIRSVGDYLPYLMLGNYLWVFTPPSV